MGRGILRGAGGDENLKSNFIWPNGAVDMQICALLTRIQCKVYDTQVTAKACGPLVYHILSQYFLILNGNVKVNTGKDH